MPTKPYDLDIELYASVRRPIIDYVQGDANAYPLNITLLVHGEPENLSDVSYVVITFKSPTGVVVQSFCDITDALNGKIKYEVAGTEINEAGENKFSIMIVKLAGENLTWEDTIFNVRERLDDGSSIPAQPEYNVLVDLINDVHPHPNEDVLDKFGEDAQGQPTYDGQPIGGGTQGIQGEKGDPGEKGDKGDTGTPGAKGDKGDPGTDGQNGQDGAQGVQGDPGAPGAPGTTGAKGDKGDTGAQGAQGIQGVKGDKGDPGLDATVPDASNTVKGKVLLGATGGAAEHDLIMSYFIDNDPMYRAFRLAQTTMVTGGKISWSGSTAYIDGKFISTPDPALHLYRLKFGNRLIMQPVNISWNSSGYITPAFPADGATIRFIGNGTPTVNPNYFKYSTQYGFYLPPSYALFYLPNVAGTASQGEFVYVYITGDPSLLLPRDLPRNLIFIAHHEPNAANPCVKLGTGDNVYPTNPIVLQGGGIIASDTALAHSHTVKISNSHVRFVFHATFPSNVTAGGTIGIISNMDRPTMDAVIVGLRRAQGGADNVQFFRINGDGTVITSQSVSTNNSIFLRTIYEL